MDKVYKRMEPCPICGLDHDVEVARKTIRLNCGDREFDVEQEVYICHNSEEDNEFCVGEMIRRNLDAVKKAKEVYNGKIY